MTRQIPALCAWQAPVLRAVLREPGITTGTIGSRFYHTSARHHRLAAAVRTLRELERLHLVQGSAGRWSPALFAAEALRAAGRRP